jgi:glutathione S-transferase
MYLLHYAPDNASLIVRLALEEIGLPYRTALVDRSRNEQRSAAYLRLNPTGLIPALETPEGPMSETGAILLWLSETHGTLAPAPGAPERGAFLKWLFFTANTLHADMRLHFYPARHAGSKDAIPDFSEVTQARIEGHIGLLETVAATRPSWLSPASPSVLGYYVAAILRWLALYPTDRAGAFDLAAYPALHALAASLEARPAATRAALAEGLGDTIFTKPSYACPPEGSAT